LRVEVGIPRSLASFDAQARPRVAFSGDGGNGDDSGFIGDESVFAFAKRRERIDSPR
jgi:hypothetical protein